jgi:lysine biosynthesis protein LysW
MLDRDIASIVMAVSECPECTFHIQLEEGMEVGQVISCPDCGAKIKLVNAFPPVFARAGGEE